MKNSAFLEAGHGFFHYLGKIKSLKEATVKFTAATNFPLKRHGEPSGLTPWIRWCPLKSSSSSVTFLSSILILNYVLG